MRSEPKSDVEPGGRADLALSFLMFRLKSNCEVKRSSFWLKQKRLESSSNNNERRWKERRPGDVFVTWRWGHWPQLERQSAANGLMPAQWHGRLLTTVKCCFGHQTWLTWTTQKRRATNKRIHRWKRKMTLWWAKLPLPCRAIVLKLTPVQSEHQGRRVQNHPRSERSTRAATKQRWSGTNEGQINGGDRCPGRIQGWVMLSMQDADGRWGCPPPRWITSFCSQALDWREFKTERLLFKTERRTKRDGRTRVSSGLHAKMLQGETVNVKRRPGLWWPVPDPR